MENRSKSISFKQFRLIFDGLLMLEIHGKSINNNIKKHNSFDFKWAPDAENQWKSIKINVFLELL